jgi:Ca2+-binding RTX toxin-like protein
LDVSGDGIGANMLIGNFTVVAAQFNYSGPTPSVERLSIAFEEHSLDDTSLAVVGTIDINRPAQPLNDRIVEAPGEGVDTVQSVVTFALPANVENLVLSGSGATKGTGNALANAITGNSAANTLDGGDGNDILTGGDGNDRFLFSTAPNAAHNVDTITDFAPGNDKIVLDQTVFAGLPTGSISSSTFVSGAGVNVAPNAATHLIYDTTSGSLYYDSDGVGGAAGIKIAILDAAPSLHAADILVVS